MQHQQSAFAPLTYDDLRNTPDDGRRYEIIDGEMLVSPSPRRNHHEASGRLNLLIHDASEGQRLGLVITAPVDVRLMAYDIVQPDLLFILRDRLDMYTPDGTVEGPPDLVVEMLSPTSHLRDLVRKAKLYAWPGVRAYWIADPNARTLTMFGLIDGRYDRVDEEGGFTRSNICPDLRIDPAQRFDGI